MPTYRTSMTLIAACVMAAGTSLAEGNSVAPKNGVIVEAKKSGYITVEESVGSALPLRQTYRLDSVRGTHSAVAELQSPVAYLNVPAMEQPPTASPVSALAILDKAAIADIANSSEASPAALPVANRTQQDRSEVSGRILELARDGALRPEYAAQLLVRLGAYPSEIAASAAVSFGAPVATRTALQGGDLVVTQGAALSGVSEEGAVARVSFVSESQAAAASVVSTQAPLSSTAERESVSLAVAPQPMVPQVEPIKLAAADPAVVPMILASAATTSPIQDAAPASWRLAREDRTVRAAVERWARQADWNLSWEFPTDFLVEFSADFDGEFIDAVTKVVDGLSGPERPLRAEFYKGNRVLRILSGRQ